MVGIVNIPKDLYKIALNTLHGGVFDWSSCKGKKILIVNTASECGFTKQYEDLQKLYEVYEDKLQVIGVPCNQFGKQEPGGSEEIQEFCKLNFGVSFPLTEKMEVKGSNQHVLYKWLTNKDFNGKKSSSVKWNFQKYLIDENGDLIDFYYSLTKPMSKKILNHLD
jgi:glutathione peroxidase